MIAIGRDGKPQLTIARLPGRKRYQLCFWTPLYIETLATFKDDESARRVSRFIEDLAGHTVSAEIGEE